MRSAKVKPPVLEPRMWSSVVRGLQLPLLEHNLDWDALLTVSGIAREDLAKPHGEIPLKKYLAFLGAAAEAAKDPLLGIKLARSAGPETLGAIGFLFLSSRTLAEAINNLCHYMNLLQDTTEVRFVQNASDVVFGYHLHATGGLDTRQDVEFSLALTCRLIRIYGGPEVQFRGVNFRHAAQGSRREYESLLKVTPYFQQDENSVVIAAASGQLRSKVLDHSLSRILQDFLDAELERRNRLQTFTDQVRGALFDGGISPPLTVPKVARYLGVSESTLYRRLKEEGTNFRDIVDRRNFEIAKTYLMDSELTVTQIGDILGYAESASFTRAFARWSNGVNPSRYRRAAAR